MIHIVQRTAQKKIATHFYSDSKLVKKVACGRTKAERIVINVIVPFSVRDIVRNLQ